MFDKLFRKVDQIKEEVFDQANKHMNEVGRNIRNGASDAINGKKSDIFSSMLGKFTDTVSSNGNYLIQIEKMNNEKKAQELGISSREIKGMSQDEIAAKYGMTTEQYTDKIAQEAEQFNNNSIVKSANEVKRRAEIELQAREKQAEEAGMSLDEFDELTLQEQADKLNMTLDVLLEQRALKF